MAQTLNKAKFVYVKGSGEDKKQYSKTFANLNEAASDLNIIRCGELIADVIDKSFEKAFKITEKELQKN